MLRNPGVLLSWLSSWTLLAQNWCPPGATWVYSISDDAPYAWQGYAVLTYSRDTLVGGQPGQVISSHSVMALDLGGMQVSDVDVAIITRHDGSVIHLNAGNDTLYAFDVAPGDQWYGSTYAQLTCPGDPFVVLDTGHVVVDGLPLKYVRIENGVNGQNTIIERIGYALFMVPQLNCQPPSAQSILRCYHDNEIDYVAPGWSGPCEGLVGIEEQRSGTSFIPYPNPGTSHFSLRLPSGLHTVEVFDAAGRVVLSLLAGDTNVQVATEALPAGLYQVRLTNRQAEVTRSRWIKE